MTWNNGKHIFPKQATVKYYFSWAFLGMNDINLIPFLEFLEMLRSDLECYVGLYATAFRGKMIEYFWWWFVWKRKAGQNIKWPGNCAMRNNWENPGYVFKKKRKKEKEEKCPYV